MIKGPAFKIASPLCQKCAMCFTYPLASKPHKAPSDMLLFPFSPRRKLWSSRSTAKHEIRKTCASTHPLLFPLRSAQDFKPAIESVWVYGLLRLTPRHFLFWILTDIQKDPVL